MFIRNFLKAGDYVTLIPIGLMLKVQYNEKGMIEKLFIFPDDVDRTDELLALILDNETICRKLPIVNGTSWVYGVLLDPNYVPTDPGLLPDCVIGSCLAHFVAHPSNHKFFAGNIYSNAIAFKASVSTRQWLVSNGFEVLPGFIFAANATEDSFMHMINTAKLPVPVPRISGYFVLTNGDCEYHSLDFYQYKITDVSTYSDMSGRIYGKLTYTEGQMDVDYSEIVKFNIHPNSLIMCDENDEIIWYYTAANTGSPRSAQIICPTCGKIINVVPDKVTQCSDPHCNSRLYGRVVQLLRVLNLPSMDYDTYKLISSQYGLDFEVPDALTWIELEDKFPLEVSIDRLLRAIVPEYTISSDNSSILTAFCNRCNNVIETVRYYITHPDKIVNEPNFNGLALNSFIVWISDETNAADVLSLLNNDKFKLAAQNRRFDGAPIFRSNTIAITGKFMHGTHDDIVAILQSYSATVVTSYASNLMCIVVGDMNEDIDGHLLRTCRAKGIHVFTESEFFAKYDIDSDLVANLK